MEEWKGEKMFPSFQPHLSNPCALLELILALPSQAGVLSMVMALTW
jgi:hypothetical protein